MKKAFRLILYLFFSSSGNGWRLTLSNFTSKEGDYPDNCTRISHFTDENDVKSISALMKEENVTSAWLPLKRVRFKEWRWIDKTIHGATISPPGYVVEGADCALLRAGDNIIDDVACSRSLDHFICEDANTNCSETANMYKCVHLKEKTYLIFSKEKYTWYMSKQHCHEINLTLASIAKKDRLAVMERISLALPHNGKVWLGLIKAKYMYQPTKKALRDVNQFNWAAGSPCMCPEKECVILREGKWEAERCSSNHNFICVSQEKQAGEGLENKELERNLSPAPFLAAIVCGILGSIVLVLIFFFFARKHYRKSRNFRTSQEKEGLRVPLIDKPVGIKAKISQIKEPNKPEPNIIFIGLQGTGKSSLINSLIAAYDQGGLKELATVGKSGQRQTKELAKYSLQLQFMSKEDQGNGTQNIFKPNFWDCPAFIDDAGSTTEKVLSLLKAGAIPEGTDVYELVINKDNLDSEMYHPDASRSMDLLCFVIERKSSYIPTNLIKSVSSIAAKSKGDEGTPVLFIIRKKDTLSKEKIESTKKEVLNEIPSDLHDHVYVVDVTSYKQSAKQDKHKRAIETDMCKIWTHIIYLLLERPLHGKNPSEIQVTAN